MTDTSINSRGDRELFAEKLGTLIKQAYEEGMEVEQHWAVLADDNSPDWEVEIVRVQSTASTD